jgi:hypothetical protein
MNVLEHYNKNKLLLSDPYTLDDDTYFCKFSYNNMPLTIKTNKICYIKGGARNKFMNVSLTSQDYLIWFESFYKDCIQMFYDKSPDWFEDPLELNEIEYSFVNPLKSNIRDQCFDVQCIIDTNRLNINDSNENMIGLDSISDSKVIPTFHIKGIKFNSKHFMFEIELTNLYIILDTVEPEPTTTTTTTTTTTNVEVSNNNVEVIEKVKRVETLENEVTEVNIPTKNLEEATINIDENGFYKIYEMINNKIKENMAEHLRNIFIQKKIKNEIDLTELVDDEDI